MKWDRFDPSADTLDDAKQYLLNRAKQLLVDDISFCGFEDIHLKFPGVVTAHFLNNRTKISYASHYILKSFRGRGLYEQVINYIGKPIVTSPDCELESFLRSKKIPYILAATHQTWLEYEIIANDYGNIKAKRSGLFYMNHIDEGLAILNKLGNVNYATQSAFCLHPILQLNQSFSDNRYRRLSNDSWTVIFATEYRNVANAYLSPMGRRKVSDIQLSPLKEVNQMLIADKIQNRKDFEAHREKYSNAKDLDYYFKAWLERLDVSEYQYQEMKKFLS